MKKERDQIEDVENAAKLIEKLIEPCNEVYLVGRVGAPAVARDLPSGDKVVEFRVIVDRKTGNSRKRASGLAKSVRIKREVDTLDIAAWSASSRREALRIRTDDWIEIRGSVRRRFWQAPQGLASRWQVEAIAITRL